MPTSTLLYPVAATMLFAAAMVVSPAAMHTFFIFAIFGDGGADLEVGDVATRMIHVYIATSGAVLFAWLSMMYLSLSAAGAVKAQAQRPALKSAEHNVMLSVGTWFIVDSITSVYHDAARNALLNVVFALPFAVAHMAALSRE
jgi:hypothetical protein